MEASTTNATEQRSPRTMARANGDGLRDRVRQLGDRTRSLAKERSDSLAAGLGWFSVGLGLAQIAMPERVARIAGIEPSDENLRLMRTFGMRELTSGVGILTQPVPDKWLWGRVVGDLLDLAALGAAMGDEKNDRGRTLGATLAVLGVTGLDLLAAKELSRKREALAEEGREPGAKTIFRILTIKAHPANVENDWNEWVANEGSEESRDATVIFRPAPAAQGTEIRAELTYTPTAGKLGDIAQRVTHKSPGQMLGQDLRRFKMTVETGEVVKSDASIHKHMHPAQPDDRPGNLMQEEAR